MLVVEDRPERLALWFPKGAAWKAPTNHPSRPRLANRGERLADCAARGEWVFRDAEWDVDTLVLVEPGVGYAIWVSWLPGFEPWGWYVNLQEPFERRAHALQTMDLMLDVLVDQDGTWRLKDEDELDAFVRRGAFSPELAERVRADAAHATARAERGEPPFSDPWHDWRPDRAWGIPRLPAGWHTL
jgi:hypothetical protein